MRYKTLSHVTFCTNPLFIYNVKNHPYISVSAFVFYIVSVTLSCTFQTEDVPDTEPYIHYINNVDTHKLNMLCVLLCDHWATAHKGRGVLCRTQCDSVWARGSTLNTLTHTHRNTHTYTHSRFGYRPHPACVCTSQNIIETSSAVAKRAVPSAAPVET